MTADFEPVASPVILEIYHTKCRVVPDLDGIFQTTVPNINDNEVELCPRKCVGRLLSPKSTESISDQPVEKNLTNCTDSIAFGDNLTYDQRGQLEKLINDYQDIFENNPKKPSLVKKCRTPDNHQQCITS